MAFVSSTSTVITSSRKRQAICLRRTSFLQPSKPHFAWNHALLRAPLPSNILSRTTIAMQDPPHILISGAPASGKGTQCEYIVQRYGVVHISTGDMLRAAVKNGTELGKQAKGFMDAGKLVPDDLVIAMLKDRITENDCKQQGWLLDGFPRTAVQAQALSDAGILPSSVLLLEVNDDILIERVVGRRLDPQTGKIYHVKFSPATDPDVEARLIQRSDDTEEKARVRLESYYKHAQSIQTHYSSLLQRINGARAKSDVFNDISSIIDSASANDDDNDPGAAASGAATATSTPASTDTDIEAGSVKNASVAEFVRRAEEAYERGVLENEDVNWSGQAGADDLSAGGTSSYADLARRVDLVTGDIAAFLAFAYIGRATHGSKSFDFDVVKTAAPFLTAWFLTSPLLGAYTRKATMNIPSALKYFARSWALAVPMGIGLRGVLTEHVPPTAFAIASLTFTFLIVGSWRVAYVKIRGDETEEAQRGGLLDGFRMVTTLLRRW